MARKIIVRSCTVVALIAILCMTASFQTTAHAASTSTKTTQDCHYSAITLHGNQPATIKCLHNVKLVNGQFVSITNTSITSSCTGTPNAYIYDGTNYTYEAACINGFGTLNLTITMPDGFNWNDKISSYKIFSYAVAFWYNTNLGGSSWYEPCRKNVSDVGPTHNNQASSLYVYSSC